MPSLLELPQELRDMILEIVILSPAPTPSGSQISSNFMRRPTPYDLSDPEQYFLWDPNAVNPDLLLPTDDVAFKQPFASLLLTSRAIREQTISQVKRLERKGCMKYDIHLQIVNEKYWLPTWIHMPWTLPKVIPEVRLTVQACGPEYLECFRLADCSRTISTFTRMCYTMDHFLSWLTRGGASRYATSRSTKVPDSACHDCEIDILRIEVVSPLLGQHEVMSQAGMPIETLFAEELDEWPSREKMVIRPDALAEYMTKQAKWHHMSGDRDPRDWKPIQQIVVTCRSTS